MEGQAVAALRRAMRRAASPKDRATSELPVSGTFMLGYRTCPERRSPWMVRASNEVNEPEGAAALRNENPLTVVPAANETSARKSTNPNTES